MQLCTGSGVLGLVSQPGTGQGERVSQNPTSLGILESWSLEFWMLETRAQKGAGKYAGPHSKSLGESRELGLLAPWMQPWHHSHGVLSQASESLWSLSVVTEGRPAVSNLCALEARPSTSLGLQLLGCQITVPWSWVQAGLGGRRGETRGPCTALRMGRQ